MKKRFRSSLRMAYRKIHDLELKNNLLKRQNKRIQKRFERTMKEQNKDREQKGITNLPGTPRSIITRLQMSEAGLFKASLNRLNHPEIPVLQRIRKDGRHNLEISTKVKGRHI